MWVHMVNGQRFRCLNIFSACSETRNCNNSVCQHFSWLSKPLCYRKKRRKKKKKRPSTRNTSCFSLARELNLATCSTWRWISQRASDSSCRPLTAARKSLFGLLLTEAQRSGEMFKGTSARSGARAAAPRARLTSTSTTRVGWRELA